MKQFSLIIALILLNISFLLATPSAVNYSNKPLKKIYRLAKKLNKPIFIDVYADWCGPCKMMDKEVFSREDVAGVLNQNFICFKMDADDDTYIYEKFEYEITKLPTLLFLKPDGTLIQKYVGSTTGSNIISMAKAALNN